MRSGEQKSLIILLFTSILIVGVFSFIGIVFINSLDHARVFSARVDWHNEALMLANHFIADPECFGYAKYIFKYTNETGTDLLISTRVAPPLSIDRDKALYYDEGIHDYRLNIDRLMNCVRLNSPEYRLYYKVSITERDTINQVIGSWQAANIEYGAYNNQTAVEVSVPVKIIGGNSASYGLFTVLMSVTAEYMQAKVL